MLKKLISRKKDADGNRKEKEFLSLELAEIKEVSDILFKKIEKKIQLLASLEASADNKIAELQHLIQRAEAIRSGGSGSIIRQHEISALSRRGMKSSEIAKVLGMPEGEVELVLNINAHK